MNLDEAKRQKVAAWIGEGLKLSEIQSRLASELGLTLTYMEVRFLVDDLKLTPKDLPVPPPAHISPPPGPGQVPTAGEAPPDEPLAEAVEGRETAPATGAGKVSVSVDHVARPGAMVSGSVTFSDGNAAGWYLDQMGRLGLVPKQQGYRPPAQDLQTFQVELQKELQKLGF
jgi:hypothetical protein